MPSRPPGPQRPAATLPPVMLVAAGYGTRLDPLTRELPKPAVPLANRPLAWFALDHVARSGAREVVANTHHLGERLREALRACCPPRVRLTFAHEPEILGTGGGARNAWRDPERELLVFNAKLLYAPDLHAALQHHRASGAIATMLLRSMPAGAGFPAVEVDAGGRVRRIRGQGEGGDYTARMYSGVQILAPRAFRDLPQRGDIIDQTYLRWIARGERVGSVLDDAAWADAGISPAHYLEANLALATGKLRWPGITPSPQGVLLAPDARLGAGVRLRDSVVGPGAELAQGVRLEQCVVWPGARVGGSLRRAIVTPRAVVQVSP